MRCAGVDIGSRSTEVVVVEDGEIVLERIGETGHDPVSRALEMLEGSAYDRIAATGYGRHLIARRMPCEIVSEITAVASGARRLVPGCRSVIDIGGEETKAVTLDPSGAVRRFEANDRCAAGTGRFLEVVAVALSMGIGEFAEAARSAQAPAPVSSMCAVFAQSEVVSMIAGGVPRDRAARGVHEAIARRVSAMIGRLRPDPVLVLAGGVALNACMRDLLASCPGGPPVVPREPRILSALGAALFAARPAAR